MAGLVNYQAIIDRASRRLGRSHCRPMPLATHYRCTGMPTQSSAVTQPLATHCRCTGMPAQSSAVAAARRSSLHALAGATSHSYQVLPRPHAVAAIAWPSQQALALPRPQAGAQSLRVLSGHERSKCTPVHVLAAATRWQSQLSSLLAHATHLFASVGVFCACAGAPSDGQISSLTLPSLPALALPMPQAVAAITLPSQPV